MANSEPLVTIVTVCLNSVATIEATILSIANQSYRSIEYIIVDGGSTDGTLEIVQKYQSVIARVICEKDDGIYEAMNSGIREASGEVVGLLNADDCYLPGAVELVVKAWSDEPGADVFIGNSIGLDVNGQQTATFRPNIDLARAVVQIPHPSTFVSKHCYEHYGYFDQSFSYAGDKEFFYRLATASARFKVLDKELAYFRAGGLGSRVGLLAEKENFRIDCRYRGLLLATRLFLYHFITSYLKRKVRGYLRLGKAFQRQN